MVSVETTEMKDRMDHYLKAALTGPVFVENAGRKVAVLISIKEYERLASLEESDLQSKECLPEGVTGSPCAVDFK